MPNTVNKILSADKAEILGIYGQNGSGKTAIVDALYFLQKVMVGADLDQSLEDYMTIDSDTAEIFADFNIFMDGIVFEIGYTLSLSREEKEIVINREILRSAKNENGIRTNKTIFMDYQRDQTDVIFKPQKRLDEILEANTVKSVEEISRDTERDNYMTAQEAVAYGLIDSVVEKR